MAKKLYEETKIAAIAEKIREKTGTTDKYTTSEMPNGVEAAYNVGKQEGYTDGQQAEFDRFWDAFQRNNEEYLYYGYAFANRDLWTQENIEKIKYKAMKASYVAVAFSGNSSVTDLSMLRFVTQIDPWGAKARYAYNSMFNSCTNLVKCMEIDFDTVSSCPSMFNGCTALVELPVTGTLTVGGLDLHHSTKLNKASITGIINALSTTTSGLTVTLSKTAVESAYGSTTAAEWTTLVSNKSNWTISLA